MSIPLQFCRENCKASKTRMHIYNSCEARVRIAHPLLGEALRLGIPRKIGGGCHTLIYSPSAGLSRFRRSNSTNTTKAIMKRRKINRLTACGVASLIIIK